MTGDVHLTDLIRTMLESRRFFVVLNGKKSRWRWRRQRNGLPQGSTLAPIIIIIIRQPLCPVVGRRPQHAVSKLPCRVLSSAISCRSSICLSRLSTAWLVSLVVFSCHNGLQVVTREVHRSSLRRLICPAQDHFIFLTVLIISMTFVLSLTQMLVFLSLYVMLSILLSILVCAAASLFCACLVSVQVSAPYVIAGNPKSSTPVSSGRWQGG